MPYSAKAVANYFLSLANSRGEDLDHLKLQKMIYFAHGWYLAYTGQPLIPDRIEAWQYGPVIPALYYDLLHWGNEPIKGAVVDVMPQYLGSSHRLEYVQYIPTLAPYGKEGDVTFQYTVDLLNWVYRGYGRMTGPQLSALTHEKDGPWEWARKNRVVSDKPAIPDTVIRPHFKKKLQEQLHSSQVDDT